MLTQYGTTYGMTGVLIPEVLDRVRLKCRCCERGRAAKLSTLGRCHPFRLTWRENPARNDRPGSVFGLV